MKVLAMYMSDKICQRWGEDGHGGKACAAAAKAETESALPQPTQQVAARKIKTSNLVCKYDGCNSRLCAGRRFFYVVTAKNQPPSFEDHPGPE